MELRIYGAKELSYAGFMELRIYGNVAAGAAELWRHGFKDLRN